MLKPSARKAAPAAKAARTAARAPVREAANTPTGLSSEQIHERLLAAIAAHKLPPGTQLVEDRLAKVFEVSRTKIREAIGRLVHDRIAINIPNRGAFVASPSTAEAREVLAVRRLLEPAIARLVAEHASARQIATLRAHVLKEARTRATDKPHRMIPLSGEFHLLLAEMCGNGILLRTLRELEMLTALVITLYDTQGERGCPYDDHPALVDAIEARDGEAAARLMLHHLDHVEQSLDLAPRVARETRLEDAFK